MISYTEFIRSIELKIYMYSVLVLLVIVSLTCSRKDLVS